jgi:hypothetical protein
MPAKELEVLQDIRHYLQVSALALVSVACQIRDGEKGDPSRDQLEEGAEILRLASAILPRVDD